ncbi:Tannase/feruloyl esterase [Boeremia exigua]|uniref:Tannase/feruloyl esterase n=1 Tax=Boeremia exigua TaxID=749465 RepID=UPI001E8D9E66|nr:Tannase/feruloyl esterase [Boeremia exigua]KAH6641942.1 Tannase/feruloyl esterase [Boeremia exigua]
MALSFSSANCTPSAIPLPTVFGAEFLSVEASLVQNYSLPAGASDTYLNHGPVGVQPVDFCNVTLTHTHPGQHDTLHTQIWLPLPSAWNGRLQMVGGGGWVAGGDVSSFGSMKGAVGGGYVTSTVDAGVPTDDPYSSEDWALISPGNVDYLTLQNFAAKALNDGALATKAVIDSFYGKAASQSYWNGCSQGGRQGYMFAQRYPDVFDGIAAAAPAINYAEFFMTSAFPQQVLREIGEQPYPCEYQTLRRAVTAACDGLDGLIDGIISDPDACFFDPYTLVGSPANCSSASPPGPANISSAAAAAMDAVWHGLRTANGTLLWPGAGYTSNVTVILGTTCSANGTCTLDRNTLFTDWIRLFAAKDPDFDVNKMTREDYVNAFRSSVNEYTSIMGTKSPDLTNFREAGGKLLTFHGLADELIPYHGSRRYYDAVAQKDTRVHDYYRLFEAPGVEHCMGGIGGLPEGTFDALVAWVEKGTAPESLIGTDPRRRTNLLCPYPKKPTFKGKSPDFSAEDFECTYASGAQVV